MQFAVDDLWIGQRLGPAVLEEVHGELRPVAFGRTAVQQARVPKVPGAVAPGLVDQHVHLGLVDAAALADTAIVEVHDLGWVPSIARGWKIDPPICGLIKIAGPFLTAIGGYPSDRVWAPPDSVRELAGPEDGVRAVDDAVAQGSDIVKLVLHSGGPLLDDPTLHEVVRVAHRHGLPVGVHAEGRHQARRAFEAGADVLVHTPWTEALADDLLSDMAGSMRWISTLAIHSGPPLHQALDNARRFLQFGGRLDYGTDMGNGPGPAGPRTAEISALGAAGLSGDALLTSLTGRVGDHLRLDRAVCAPIPLPDSAADVAAWMHQAQRLTQVISEAVVA